MLTDDLPWPELGNVSRGATRGNQGQKGTLSPPDSEGRSIIQLRVQPGVLPVRLNRQATEWYRVLDSEVNRALKLTKTYWRKARRRQDYDARADQDHMELHEWLQQLKDKVMSHLELLMQKGEIQGPPYVMPDHLELTFLKKFIERQAAGIPHNPRLRNGQTATRSPRSVQQYINAKLSEEVNTSPSMSWDTLDDRDQSQGFVPSPTGVAFPENVQAVVGEVENNRRTLRSARAALSRAQRDTQEAFKRYKTCLDVEAQALQQVNTAEERRDTLSELMATPSSLERIMTVSKWPLYLTLINFEASASSSRQSFAQEEPLTSHLDPRSSPKQSHDQVSNAYKPNGVPMQDAVGGWRALREMQWSPHDVGGMAAPAVTTLGQAYATGNPPQQDMQLDVQDLASRKHSRSWDMAHGQGEIEVSSTMYFPMHDKP
ncbi:hypothetical protein BDY19DRAFT_992433 [Irpex rosettiformis]|uniref:Uncharacterized protein n=1 Tax=Irpex rosettiformis TaxID=378272 RepID=A0ACB8U7K4_9APHY|nr:hypothetical protein BDY19DRAFT_992433 [Irpex rosettiformis]